MAGRLRVLAGEYPVWVEEPVRAQDVPVAIARAAHEAVTGRGPAIVIVPMDDWSAEAELEAEPAAARHVLRSARVDEPLVDAPAQFVCDAERPAIVSGAGADVIGLASCTSSLSTGATRS